MKNIILYNPYSNNGQGKTAAEAIISKVTGETELTDITKIGNISEFLNNVSEEDRIILTGGDGTINRLINDLEGNVPTHELLYAPAGTGNDFFADVKSHEKDGFISLNQFITNLPKVTVNGKTSFFLNGIGYGIDGYCCEVGDELRAKSDKPVNYAGIAIKGLLFHFKPANATVTVDGVTKTYKKAWLAPTMKGRFYGGGMMIAPKQDRLNADNLVSFVCIHGSGKLKTLVVFPNIFKGAHVSHTEMVEILTGHEVTVKFDRPCALQIDGETVLNVTEYTVRA